MIVEHFPVGPLQCNCTILGDPETKEAIVVDPGGEPEKILARLQAHELRCTQIVHTHAHFDHCAATSDMQRATDAPTHLHEGDLFLYEGLQMQLDAFGIPLKVEQPVEIDRFLSDGESISAGKIEAGVLHTPGHTPGSLSFAVLGEQPVVIAGDTLFQRSIGRTDLWGGDMDTILRSIREKLFALPEDTLVITGHGPSTTIGEEKKLNPFLQAS